MWYIFYVHISLCFFLRVSPYFARPQPQPATLGGSHSGLPHQLWRRSAAAGAQLPARAEKGDGIQRWESYGKMMKSWRLLKFWWFTFFGIYLHWCIIYKVLIGLAAFAVEFACSITPKMWGPSFLKSIHQFSNPRDILNSGVKFYTALK